MLASELPFESYKSKQILFCAYLICSPVSGPKALKKMSAIFNFSKKLQNIFEIGLGGLARMVRMFPSSPSPLQ